MPGSPARLTGMVQTSFRYIASGSSVLAPISKATVGEVGAMIASNRSNAWSKSCLMSVRIFWALT